MPMQTHASSLRTPPEASRPALAPTLALSVALALGLGFPGGATLAGAPRPPDIPFSIRMLDGGASETAAVADVNGDGRPDIVSGEHWYEAPDWRQHRFRELHYTGDYIDAFSDLPIDVDGDGAVDLVTVSWFGKKIAWWKNVDGRHWSETIVESGFPVEFAFLVDLDNDGRARELLPQFGDTKAPLAWYEVRNGAWQKHVVSPQSYGHGIGAGDVNGDGRTDILTPKGWFEAPADPRAPDWRHRAAWDEKVQLGFMHVLDLNADGRKDVLTTAGHDYGQFWFEQGPEDQWTRRVLTQSWSQAHASTLVDLNGDGRLDLVTGKRYMAHNGNDPGEREPLGVYWYEHRVTPVSGGGGSVGTGGGGGSGVEWIRHVIDYGGRMGGGMQIPVADLDRDGDLDLVCAGKSGLFLVENRSPRTSGPTDRGRPRR